MFAAMLSGGSARRHSRITERLACSIADDEALWMLIDYPRRRQAARGGHGVRLEATSAQGLDNKVFGEAFRLRAMLYAAANGCLT
jgi:hypothetical protein